MAATMTTVVKGTEESGNFFGRMAWYYQMGVLLLLSLLLIWGIDLMLYSSTRKDTDSIKEKVEKLKADNVQGSIVVQNLAAVEQTLKDKREEIDRLRDLLPDQVQISSVYENIKDFLREQKLELKRFVHEKAISAEFYTAQPIRIEVTGSYDSLGQFFSRLGFYSRIVNVTDVEIKQAEDGGQEVGRSINGSFVLTAYFMSPENLEKLTLKRPVAPPTATPAAPAGAAK